MVENVKSFKVEGKSSVEIYLSGSACKPFSGLSDDSVNKNERKETINASIRRFKNHQGLGAGDQNHKPRGILYEFIHNHHHMGVALSLCIPKYEDKIHDPAFLPKTRYLLMI